MLTTVAHHDQDWNPGSPGRRAQRSTTCRWCTQTLPIIKVHGCYSTVCPLPAISGTATAQQYIGEEGIGVELLPH